MARLYARHASLPRPGQRACESPARTIHRDARNQQSSPRMETLDDAPRRLRRTGGNVAMKSNFPRQRADSSTSRSNRALAECQSLIPQITNLRHVSARPFRHEAYTLIEVLVYMSMLVVVMALGYTAMYRSMDA